MMNPLQLLECIRFGLPSYQLLEFEPESLSARLRFGGQVFDVSVVELDGYPLLLVSQGGNVMEMNNRTDKVLQLLESVVEEVMAEPAPWPDKAAMMQRLREMIGEDGDDV